MVIRNTKDAEGTLKTYETRLRDVNKVPTDKKEVENYRSQLKVRGGGTQRQHNGFLVYLIHLVYGGHYQEDEVYTCN